MTTSRQPIALIAVLVLLSAAAAVVLPQLFDSTDKRESTATPQRLVSLTPAVSDILVELGIADNVVGRSDYCASPEIESASVTGTGIQPNYEAIVALKPDLVLAAASAGLDVATLSKIAPVEALGWSNLDALMASIQRLGTLTDKSAEADALVKRFQERFDSKVAPDGPRTDPGGHLAANKQSFKNMEIPKVVHCFLRSPGHKTRPEWPHLEQRPGWPHVGAKVSQDGPELLPDGPRCSK